MADTMPRTKGADFGRTGGPYRVIGEGRTVSSRATATAPERDYSQPLLGLWAMSITHEVGDAAKQVMLRLKLRREHGSGLSGQVVYFDRHGAGHEAMSTGASE